MENQKINFRKERDFGEVINATFIFLKQEYKKLGTVLLFYVIPFLIIAGILQSYAQTELFGSVMNSENMSNISGFFSNYIISILILLFSYAVLVCAIYCYIDIYIEKSGDFTHREVFERMKSFIIPVILANLAVGFLVGIGFMFCIIPGIYLGVSLSVILIALIIEKQGFGEAFSRSFALTKLQWWWTFLLLIVAGLIAYLLAILINVPAMILGFSSMFHNISKGVNPMETMSATKIFIMTMTSMLSYIVYVIPYTAIAFHYFNLVELNEKPSLMEKIEGMGKNE